MSTPKLLGISGSLRAGSFNTMLLKAAITSYGDASVEIADINFPLYSGDVEAVGISEAVTMFADQIAKADAIIIANPEYNKGISGVLKKCPRLVEPRRGHRILRQANAGYWRRRRPYRRRDGIFHDTSVS